MLLRSVLIVLLFALGAGAAGSKAIETASGVLGLLNEPRLWAVYKQRFITAQGRVVDTGNGGISHSEGQGYGMVLALAARDRDGFDRIWGWTRANLLVRGDQLAAWRFEPDKRPAIADMNNATDGDILIAWALAEAAEVWRDPAYLIAARRIAVEIGRKLILRRPAEGALLLPGVSGFGAEDRPDGPVINLSYWVFPAFDRLSRVAPEHDWAGLARNGLVLIAQAQPLPADWTALGGGPPRPAADFPPLFAHNALRVPLYLAWAGYGELELHKGFLSAVAGRAGAPIVELTSGRQSGWLPERGYGAVATLVECAVHGHSAPTQFREPAIEREDYYPSTLHLLSLIAMKTRYPRCLSPI